MLALTVKEGGSLWLTLEDGRTIAIGISQIKGDRARVAINADRSILVGRDRPRSHEAIAGQQQGVAAL